MIGKTEFINLITEYKKQNERVDNLCKIFSKSYDDPIIDWGFIIFDKLINSLFDEIGEDWIQYYLYENPEQCYYQDEVRISLETLDDLWILIESHRK